MILLGTMVFGDCDLGESDRVTRIVEASGRQLPARSTYGQSQSMSSRRAIAVRRARGSTWCEIVSAHNTSGEVGRMLPLPDTAIRSVVLHVPDRHKAVDRFHAPRRRRCSLLSPHLPSTFQARDCRHQEACVADAVWHGESATCNVRQMRRICSQHSCSRPSARQSLSVGQQQDALHGPCSASQEPLSDPARAFASMFVSLGSQSRTLKHSGPP